MRWSNSCFFRQVGEGGGVSPQLNNSKGTLCCWCIVGRLSPVLIVRGTLYAAGAEMLLCCEAAPRNPALWISDAMSNPDRELLSAVLDCSEMRESRDWDMLEEALVELERSSWWSDVVRHTEYELSGPLIANLFSCQYKVILDILEYSINKD